MERASNNKEQPSGEQPAGEDPMSEGEEREEGRGMSALVRAAEAQQQAGDVNGEHPSEVAAAPPVAAAAAAENPQQVFRDVAYPKAKNFAQRLMYVLETGIASDQIFWVGNGTAVALHPTKLEEGTTMNDYFNVKSYSTFIRNCNRWGFGRVTLYQVPHGVVTYQCSLFNRNQPHLVKYMRMDSTVQDEYELSGIIRSPKPRSSAKKKKNSGKSRGSKGCDPMAIDTATGAAGLKTTGEEETHPHAAILTNMKELSQAYLGLPVSSNKHDGAVRAALQVIQHVVAQFEEDRAPVLASAVAQQQESQGVPPATSEPPQQVMLNQALLPGSTEATQGNGPAMVQQQTTGGQVEPTANLLDQLSIQQVLSIPQQPPQNQVAQGGSSAGNNNEALGIPHLMQLLQQAQGDGNSAPNLAQQQQSSDGGAAARNQDLVGTLVRQLMQNNQGAPAAAPVAQPPQQPAGGNLTPGNGMDVANLAQQLLAQIGLGGGTQQQQQPQAQQPNNLVLQPSASTGNNQIAFVPQLSQTISNPAPSNNSNLAHILGGLSGGTQQQQQQQAQFLQIAGGNGTSNQGNNPNLANQFIVQAGTQQHQVMGQGVLGSPQQQQVLTQPGPPQQQQQSILQQFLALQQQQQNQNHVNPNQPR